jgi:hypothetical protein
MYNILVCDDDKEIVEAIEIYLTQEGYRILKAYDGTEALEMLEREEVHLNCTPKVGHTDQRLEVQFYGKRTFHRRI